MVGEWVAEGRRCNEENGMLLASKDTDRWDRDGSWLVSGELCVNSSAKRRWEGVASGTKVSSSARVEPDGEW